MIRLVTMVLVFLYAASWPAVVHGSQKFSIGTRGAEITVHSGWRRGELMAGGGKDQFSRRGTDYAIIYNDEVLLESRADVLEYYAKWREITGPSLTNPKYGQVKVKEKGGTWFGRQHLDYTSNGLKVSMLVGVVSRAGLTFEVRIWALVGRAKVLPSAMNDFWEGFTFPGPDTEWGKSTIPTQRTVLAHGDRVTFEFVDSIWEETKTSDALLYLESPGGELECMLFASDNSVEEDIQATFEHVRDELFPGLTEVSREPVSVSGASGLALRAEVRRDDVVTVSCIFYALALSAGKTLELRFISHADWDVRSAFRERFLSSIEISRWEDVDAFPSPESSPTKSAAPVPHMKAFLEKCDYVGSVPRVRPQCAFRLANGQLVACGRGIIAPLEKDGSFSPIFESDWTFRKRSVIPIGNQIYFKSTANRLALLKDGSFVWPEFVAMAGASLGEEALFIRRQPQGSDALFSRIPAVGPDRFVLRSEEGTETELEASPGGIVSDAVASRGIPEVLITQRPARIAEVYMSHEPHEVFAFHPRTKIRKSLGRWRIEQIGPADNGWVVTGAPVGGASGVHLLERTGQSRLLLSGLTFFGVELRKGRLLLAGSVSLPQHPRRGGTAFYEASMEVLAELGPAVMPFSGFVLNELGSEARQALKTPSEGVFRTWESIQAYVAAAQEVGRARFGRELPTDGTEVDQLFADTLRVAWQLNTDGEVLSAALLVAALVSEGAEWVGAEGEVESLAWYQAELADNCFAYSKSPLTVVRSTFHDQDGYWRPIRELTAEAEGRQILLGVDLVALEQRLKELNDDRLPSLLATGDAGELRVLFDAIPENWYLRQEAYEHLYARDHFLAMEEAARFSETPAAIYIDHLASLGARKAQLVGEPSPDLIEAARKAIAKYPEAPRLYLFLGQLYAMQSTDPKASARARACFARAVRLNPNGDAGERAQRELDALGP